MAADVVDDVPNRSTPAVCYARRKDPENGWWSYDADESRLLSGLRFTFSTAADSSELAPEIVPGADNPLQQILLCAIGLRVDEGAGRSSLIEALESADDPLPKLENLEISRGTEEEVVDCLLKAIENEKFSLRLRCLSFRVWKRDEWIERLGHLIRAHRLPLLSELSFYSKGDNFFIRDRRISNRAGELSFTASLEHLTTLGSLGLSVSGFGIGHRVLAELLESKHLQNLQTLDLKRTSVEILGCKAYAKALRQGRLPALRKLDLSWNDLGEEGGEALGGALGSISFPELQILNLGHCSIGDRGAAALATALGSGHLKSLKRLSLGGNRIGHAGMVDLASSFDKSGFPNLSSVDVSRNRTRVAALATALRQGRLPALRKLDLSDNYLGEESCEALGGALGSISFPELQILKLKFCNIGDRGAAALATALGSGHLKSLKHLSLGGNGIGDAGMVDLASSFDKSGFPNLSSVDVSRNRTRAAALATALATALRQGRLPALRILNLSVTDLGEEGCEALGGALGSISFPELQILELGHCRIGDRGAAALATALGSGHLKSLKFLSLEENRIGDVGMVDLATALTSGGLNGLETLRIGTVFRATSKKAVEAIFSAYASNTVLCAEIEGFPFWHEFSELEERYRHLLERNRRIAKLLSEIGGKRAVAAQFSKVYLCGRPLVGKTTLSKSLKRSFWKALWAEWLPRRHPEPRTRGIQVSRLIDRKQSGGEVPLALLLWDMAGQDEYHLVHNTFLSELTGGKASSFVVVCSSDNDEKEEKDLTHWLRFIASSCGKSRQNPREVLVVVNRMHGNSGVLKRSGLWKDRLYILSKQFGEYLAIHPVPFIVDVRERSAVQELKARVIQNSRMILENQLVPGICQSIQQKLPKLCADNAHFPVLHWDDFVKALGLDTEGSKSAEDQSPRMIDAATKYLNEAGVVIYINAEFPSEWNIPKQKLVVVDPNWICNQVVGSMFLSDTKENSGEEVFRQKVGEHTGSIALSDLVVFFTFLGIRDVKQCNDLVTIMLWLGLCYKDREENVIIPALIRGDRSGIECWAPGKSVSLETGQWVMGYAVERKHSEITLAPIAVWHRFQVDLAQTPGYNGKVDNEFKVGKYFVTFKFEQMSVLIEVDASQDHPTFDRISMVVKPLLPAHRDMDLSARKRKQVDVASYIVERLVNLWMQVCPGVSYVRQVVQPWPVSSNQGLDEMKMHLFAEVKRWVQEHGLGTPLNWRVGSDTISGDQLLSTKDKEELVQSSTDVLRQVQSGLDVVRQGVSEAVELGIFPSETLYDKDGVEVSNSASAEGNDEGSSAPCAASSSHPVKKGDSESLGDVESSESRIIQAVGRVHQRVDVVIEKVDNISKQGETYLRLTGEIQETMRKQDDMLRRVLEVGEIFLNANERKWPSFVYLGGKDSNAWTTLKEAMSPVVTVHLQFACEANHDGSGLHPVENQRGIDVRQPKEWLQKISPCLKVTIAALSISAKVAANLIAPGMGILIPFPDWAETKVLSDCIVSATGYTEKELDKLAEGKISLDDGTARKSFQELRRESKRAVAELLGKLTSKEFEEKLGLYRVLLLRNDGSPRGVSWICRGCYDKYEERQLVRDFV